MSVSVTARCQQKGLLEGVCLSVLQSPVTFMGVSAWSQQSQQDNGIVLPHSEIPARLYSSKMGPVTIKEHTHTHTQIYLCDIRFLIRNKSFTY